MEVVRQAVAEGKIQHTGTSMGVLHSETILPFESPELDDEKMQVLLSVSDSQPEVTLQHLGLLKIHDEPAIEQAATLMIAKDSSGDLVFGGNSHRFHRFNSPYRYTNCQEIQVPNMYECKFGQAMTLVKIFATFF